MAENVCEALRASQNIYTIVEHPDGTFQGRILEIGQKQPQWVGEPRRTWNEVVKDLPELTWDWVSLDNELFEAEVSRRNSPGRPRIYRQRVRTSLELSPEVLAAVDKARGEKSRAVYIEEVLRRDSEIAALL